MRPPVGLVLHWADSTVERVFKTAHGAKERVWNLLLHSARFIGTKLEESNPSGNIICTGTDLSQAPNSQWRDVLSPGAQPDVTAPLAASLARISTQNAVGQMPSITFIFVYVGDKAVVLPSVSTSGGAKVRILAFADSVDDSSSLETLHNLAAFASSCGGSLDVIELQDYGYLSLQTILQRISDHLPQPHKAALFLGHLSVPVELSPNPAEDGWLQVAISNKLPLAIPKTLSITGFVDMASVPHPVVLRQYEIVSVQAHPLMMMLPKVMRSRRAAVVSLSDSWVALLCPSTTETSLRLLILAPTPENEQLTHSILTNTVINNTAASQAASLPAPVGLYAEQLEIELNHLLEAIKGLPATAKQMFYVTDTLRQRARQLATPGLLECVGAILEEERRKYEPIKRDAAFIIEELQYLITQGSAAPFEFHGIDPMPFPLYQPQQQQQPPPPQHVAPANNNAPPANTSTRMSVDFILY